MEEFWTRRRAVVALWILFALAVALRLPGFENSLAPDEAYSYDEYIRPGLHRFLFEMYQCNNQPLNSLAAWASSRLLGSDADWMLRLPAFLAAMALLPVAYLFSKRAFGGRGPALAAVLVLTVHLSHITYSTNFRSYSLVMLFALLTTWQLAAHLSRPRWLLLAGMALTSFCMAYSHVVALLLYAGWGLALAVDYLLRGRRDGWFARPTLFATLGGGGALGVGLALTSIAYSPAFSLPMAMVARVFTGEWPVDAFAFVSGAEQTRWLPFDHFTSLITTGTGLWFWAFATLALAGCIAALIRGNATAGVLLAVLAGPVIALLVTGLKIEPRYSLTLVPIFACAYAGGAAWLASMAPAGAARAIALAFLLGVFSMVSLFPYATNFERATADIACVDGDTKGAISEIAQRAGDGDILLLGEPGNATFDHYADKLYNRFHPAVLPATGPVRIWTPHLHTLRGHDWSSAYGMGQRPADTQREDVLYVDAQLADFRQASLPPLATLTPGDLMGSPTAWTLWHAEGGSTPISIDPATGTVSIAQPAGFAFSRVRSPSVPCAPGRLVSMQVWVKCPRDVGDIRARLYFEGAANAFTIQSTTREPRPNAPVPEGWHLLHLDALAAGKTVYMEIEWRGHFPQAESIGIGNAALWLDGAP